ncbi:hypothetical protein E3N88_23041 [Mikania micrantha]|uniref:Zinc finger, CCHC-type n=1 Tax=Mikania micrantha TaxID=192012 RepID=A0A5N6NDX0_9ASTR|nr:hypothetical protein E3N88_23041 [Mikania micrantha]
MLDSIHKDVDEKGEWKNEQLLLIKMTDGIPLIITLSGFRHTYGSRMMSKFDKLEKFEGWDFKRWKKKMHFLLTILKVVYVFSTPIPELLEDGNLDQIRKQSKLENDNYICLGHILNGMCDALFNVYQNLETAKVLWDAQEAKFMAEDSSSK